MDEHEQEHDRLLEDEDEDEGERDGEAEEALVGKLCTPGPRNDTPVR